MTLTWSKRLLSEGAKRIVLSGPSGFLGTRVLNSILSVHAQRKAIGVEPGEVILLSASPGRLMERLRTKFGKEVMKTVRASRVDYYSQHSVESWIHHLGAVGAEGPSSVFVNLAAVAGPIAGRDDALMAVNYTAAVAAARAASELGFGHFIQSSTQATNAERAGQVPYARGKSMADFALAREVRMPVTIAVLGLLYCKEDGIVGQDNGEARLNLIDLSLLPLTPILGNGTAPLQPQEVMDAARRISYLALSSPENRPQTIITSHRRLNSMHAEGKISSPGLRIYDAVGPETVTMLELLQRFASYQGKQNFIPVFIDYRNMERILNIKSLGNLNRQFVSLLRSEQEEGQTPFIGDSRAWNSLLEGSENALLSLDEAFACGKHKTTNRRRFPFLKTASWVANNPKVIIPGIKLGLEILQSFLFGPPFPSSSSRSTNSSSSSSSSGGGGGGCSRK